MRRGGSRCGGKVRCRSVALVCSSCDILSSLTIGFGRLKICVQKRNYVGSIGFYPRDLNSIIYDQR